MSLQVLVADKVLATNEVGGVEGGGELIEKFVESKTGILSKSKKISGAKTEFRSSLFSRKMTLRCLIQNPRCRAFCPAQAFQIWSTSSEDYKHEVEIVKRNTWNLYRLLFTMTITDPSSLIFCSAFELRQV